MDCAPEWAPGRESSLRSAGWASKGSGEALHLAVGRHVRARKLPLELVWIKNHPDDGSTSVYCSTDEKCRLDSFCGCGTATAAAQTLGRNWIGIDITQLAISLVRYRLRDSFSKNCRFEIIGEPTSLEDATVLAAQDPYQFQWWALGLVEARPVEQKRGADQGIDGRLYFHDEGRGKKTKKIIFSVKAGHVTVSQVRDFVGVVNREKAQIRVFLSLNPPTAPMRREAASAGFYKSPWGNHPRIQLLTIEELLSGKDVDYPQAADVTFKRAKRIRTGSSKQQNHLPMQPD